MKTALITNRRAGAEQAARKDTRWGFSLIEMLTVIAVIAILMALLFPVIVQQRAKARRNACAANMAEIAGGLRMYKLDNGSYPPVLYGFVHKHDEGVPGDVVYGLYPHWVQSATTFVCPNNPYTRITTDEELIRLQNADGSPVGAGRLTPIAEAPELSQGRWAAGVARTDLFPSGVAFSKGDSYDASVMPTEAYRQPNPGWERHYALQWLPMVNLRTSPNDILSLSLLGNSPAEKMRTYARQLVFRQPDDSTVVTVCTYHRAYPTGWTMGGQLPTDSTDIVLFLDGHTEMRRSSEFNVYTPTGSWAGWQVTEK